MKEKIVIYLSFLVSLLLLSSVYKNWLTFSYLPLWLGGILGSILPISDHLLYVFFLKPQELASQRVIFLFKKKDFQGVLRMLALTRHERTNLIFHTAYFQAILILLTFFVVTSSGSLLGRGIVFAFYLNLLLNQIMDFSQRGNLNNWFSQTPLELDHKKTIYILIGESVLLLIFAFLF